VRVLAGRPAKTDAVNPHRQQELDDAVEGRFVNAAVTADWGDDRRK
jgi:hypothetical protein